MAITKLLAESNREFVKCTEKASTRKEFDKLDCVTPILSGGIYQKKRGLVCLNEGVLSFVSKV